MHALRRKTSLYIEQIQHKIHARTADISEVLLDKVAMAVNSELLKNRFIINKYRERIKIKLCNFLFLLN